jgi:hypothetical protein
MSRTLDRSRKAAVSAGLALLVAACSSGGATPAPSASATEAATTAPITPEPATAAPSPTEAASLLDQDLTAVCPANVVIQTNWYPEPDHAFTYQPIGATGTVDAEKLTYSGPLGNTGVTLEVRAGGPAVGYQQVTSLLYQDDSILLGYVGTDEAIQNSKDQPTISVLAPLEKNPQAVIWGDPSWDFTSVADIGAAGVTYLAFEGSTYLDLWTGKGLLKPEQIDTSYQGGEARFIAEDGKITQQAFVTSEPYRLEFETPEWNKPVKFLLVGDALGVYQSALSIRSDRLEANRACLEKLVPIFQQSIVDYYANPEPINTLLVDYVAKIQGGGFTLSAGLAADSTKKAIELGLVSNAGNTTVGDVDTARVQTLIDDLAPVFEAGGKAVKPGLTPADLATNEFLDPAIALP